MINLHGLTIRHSVPWIPCTSPSWQHHHQSHQYHHLFAHLQCIVLYVQEDRIISRYPTETQMRTYIPPEEHYHDMWSSGDMWHRVRCMHKYVCINYIPTTNYWSCHNSITTLKLWHTNVRKTSYRCTSWLSYHIAELELSNNN